MNAASANPPVGILAWLVGLGMRAQQSIQRHERRCLFVTLAIFALLTAHHACTTPLWFDEFFTFFISRLPSLPQMLRVIPADGQPPLQYLLTRLSLLLFGQSEFAIRLPEILAYIAAGLLTYRIVRRHGSSVQALFATVTLLGSYVDFEHAFMARPYSLLLAFTALAFLCWQHAAVTGRRLIPALCGLALGIAGAVLSHHFGVLCAGIFLLPGEAARLCQRRRLDLWMAATILAGLSPLAFTLPLAHQSSRDLGQAILHSSTFWAKPSPLHLLGYVGMIAWPPICLFALFAFLPWPQRKTPISSSSTVPVPAYEWAAAVGLSLLLPVLLVISSFETGYFISRYAISSSLGLALLSGWALPRLPGLRAVAQPLLALSTLASLLFVGIFLLWAQFADPAQRGLKDANAVSPLLLNAPEGLPIVIASAFDYVPDWWYAPPSLRERLVYLADPPYAARQADFLPEFTLILDRQAIPMPVSNYADYTAAHPRFLLLRSGLVRLNWTDTRLANSGWHLTPIAKSGSDILYQVDHPLPLSP